MSNHEFGLSDQGFRPKRLNDIRKEVEDALKDTFGDDFQLGSDSVAIQLVMPAMAQLSQVWEGMEQVYNSFSPDQATGEALVNLARVVGLAGRLRSSPSTGSVTLSGDPNVIVPEGTVFENSTTEDTFVTTEQGTFPGDGSDITVAIRSQEDGPIQAEPGSIDTIRTPVSGLDSVSNANTLSVGRLRESDSELRLRREQSLFIGGKSVDLAMRAELLETEGVTQAVVISNRTNDVDANGLEPGFMSILYPVSSDQDYVEGIASTVFRAQPAGIRSQGDQEVLVEDEEGREQSVFFQFAIEQQVNVTIDLEVDRNYPSSGGSGDTLVEEVITSVLENQRIGQDVRFLPYASAIQQEIEGVLSIDISFENLTDPETGTSLSIDFNEIAIPNVITVTSTRI